MCDQKTKKKIAFVVDKYRRGGVALVLRVLLQYLAKEDTYDITLFVRDYDEKTMLSVPEGVVCRPWPAIRTVSGTLSSAGVSDACDVLRNHLCAALNVRNYGRKAVYTARRRAMFPGEYDCVIAYHMIPNDVTVAALEKVRARRKLLWMHFRKKIADRDISFYHNLYAGADAIVCVSGDMERQLLDRLPGLADKTCAIHNLYDISQIRSRAAADAEGMDLTPGPMKIVTVARLAREKGYDRVPTAARMLADAGYDFRWYIVGEGDKRQEIEADIREKGLTDRIILLGHRDNPYPYIRNCDIYAQASYIEGFCTSTMEAKILGKPVVTTDAPGMREQFISGENGLIVESSADGLYQGLRQMMDDPALREKIGEKLRMEPVPNDEVLRQTMAAIDGR